VLAGHVKHGRRSERRSSGYLNWVRVEELGIGGRRQVQDSVERLRDVKGLRHVVVEQLEALAPQQVLDTQCTGGEEIVHSENLVPTPDEEIAEVRPDEAGSTGDEKAQSTIGGQTEEGRFPIPRADQRSNQESSTK